MKKILKDTLALVLIATVAVLCLAVIYQFTKEPIANAEKEEKIASFREVCADADTFDEQSLIGEDGWQGEIEGATVTEAYVARDAAGNAIGCVLSVTTNKGYGGNIVLSVGITGAGHGTVQGVKVMSMSETAGLGAKCQDETWIGQFKGISAAAISAVKTGKSADNEIDAITSATYTTEAVTGAVNTAIAYYQTLTEGGKIQ